MWIPKRHWIAKVIFKKDITEVITLCVTYKLYYKGDNQNSIVLAWKQTN